ncbi:intraflagellar transport protein 88 homolog isoform X2 [Hydra vulgaris]|uniref:Intraflagellar transport protein 88 homolog isoform X2 n=1 Tax=Hydra vulgaris TaxID=6087 RepID=A0ABM4BHX7_HYDVU
MSWENSMLNSVHLVGEDDTGDLYNDFENVYDAAFDTEGLYEDEGFQKALKTSYGKRLGSSAGRPPLRTAADNRMNTSLNRGHVAVPSMGGRLATGVATNPAQARPMTAVRAAGYSSTGKSSNTLLDPLLQTKGPASSLLDVKSEDSPEEKLKILEKQTMALVEESCYAAERNDFKLALEKAKEAGRMERNLCRHQEQSQLTEHINLDITYSVLFNLASSYHNLQMYNEAINTYNVIIKNKMFSNAGRLRINIGNIYYVQRNYPQAIKYYRMALDQIPQTHKQVRIPMMKNIAMVFVKMAQYSDALTTYEHIMTDLPDMQTGFNLLLCAYALNDKEKMKKSFQKLTQIASIDVDNEKYNPSANDHHGQMVLDAIRDDSLRRYNKQKQLTAERYITMAAKLIAPVIEDGFDEGFDWCTDIVKASPYIELANELEITRSLVYLKQKDFTKAAQILKKFEKKSSKMQSQAAVNLSFLYFLEGDVAQSDKHAEIAISSDRYNPAALLNKGNAEYHNGNYLKAKDYYAEALNIEASCTEALHNLGLCYKKMSKFDEALECFHKLNLVLPNNAEVICQIGQIYENDKNTAEALEWYQQLLNIVPTDCEVLRKVAMLYEEDGDKSQAFQYMYEAFRYYPSCIKTLVWLGGYYIDAQFIEKAITYFERAVQVQPLEVRWHLMLATCYRKAGNYAQAMETYKEIHKKFPENLDCIRFLVKLCQDQGLSQEQNEYSQKLIKIQKMLEQKEQRVNSGKRKGSGKVQKVSEENIPVTPDRVSSGKEKKGPKNVDSSYADPMGDTPVRPKTAAASSKPKDIDEFADEEICDDLLPD